MLHFLTLTLFILTVTLPAWADNSEKNKSEIRALPALESQELLKKISYCNDKILNLNKNSESNYLINQSHELFQVNNSSLLYVNPFRESAEIKGFLYPHFFKTLNPNFLPDDHRKPQDWRWYYAIQDGKVYKLMDKVNQNKDSNNTDIRSKSIFELKQPGVTNSKTDCIHSTHLAGFLSQFKATTDVSFFKFNGANDYKNNSTAYTPELNCEKNTSTDKFVPVEDPKEITAVVYQMQYRIYQSLESKLRNEKTKSLIEDIITDPSFKKACTQTNENFKVEFNYEPLTTLLKKYQHIQNNKSNQNLHIDQNEIKKTDSKR